MLKWGAVFQCATLNPPPFLYYIIAEGSLCKNSYCDPGHSGLSPAVRPWTLLLKYLSNPVSASLVILSFPGLPLALINQFIIQDPTNLSLSRWVIPCFQRQDWMRSPLLKALTCHGYPQGLPACFASDRLIPQAQVQSLSHLCLSCTLEKGPTTRCSIIGICIEAMIEKNRFLKKEVALSCSILNQCMLKASYVDVI